jgi:hypothetical protein
MIQKNLTRFVKVWVFFQEAIFENEEIPKRNVPRPIAWLGYFFCSLMQQT